MDRRIAGGLCMYKVRLGIIAEHVVKVQGAIIRPGAIRNCEAVQEGSISGTMAS